MGASQRKKKITAINAAVNPPTVRLVFIRLLAFSPALAKNLIRLKLRPSNDTRAISDAAERAAEARPTSAAL